MTKNTDKEFTRDEIAKALYINGDQELLLRKIRKWDKTALVQLVMINMPYIISCAQREQYEGLPITALIDAATSGFILAAEKAANENLENLDDMWKSMHWAIGNALENVKGTYKRRIYDTPERIAYLNKLNKLLTEKEKQIVARVDEYLALAKKKMKSKGTFTSDYELEVEIGYYAKGGTEPMHYYRSVFRYEKEYKEGMYGLLCDSEDWNEGWPVLDEKYCYLLHDLIDHSRIGNKLFSISQIWFDIKFWDQNCVKGKKLWSEGVGK